MSVPFSGGKGSLSARALANAISELFKLHDRGMGERKRGV